MKYAFYYLQILLFSTLIATSNTCFALAEDETDEINVAVSADIDIAVQRFASSGNYLIIWLAPEYGLRTNHRKMAGLLAEHNIEVWLVNIVESLFMPQGTRSLKELDGSYVAEIIANAHKQTGKKIIVAGDSYAAISVLRGVHQWQQRQQKEHYLIGSILFSPALYAYIPELGLVPEFMPVTGATNTPVMIYQAQKSGNLTQFNQLLEVLQQNNNSVYSQIIPDVRSLFYTEETIPQVITHIKQIASKLDRMVRLLEKHEVPAQAALLEKNIKNDRGMDNYLKEFKGNKDPHAIKLVDAHGKTFNKTDYQGQVTVINFWATWCPPCVQEIPSLNRLKKHMNGLPFELISVNYAEDKETIINFMKKVNVEFPVLLDNNGSFAKKWNVVTYPSTFIVAPDGEIKYGVNAAIEWDDPEFISKIKSLLEING